MEKSFSHIRSSSFQTTYRSIIYSPPRAEMQYLEPKCVKNDNLEIVENVKDIQGTDIKINEKFDYTSKTPSTIEIQSRNNSIIIPQNENNDFIKQIIDPNTDLSDRQKLLSM